MRGGSDETEIVTSTPRVVLCFARTNHLPGTSARRKFKRWRATPTVEPPSTKSRRSGRANDRNRSSLPLARSNLTTTPRQERQSTPLREAAPWWYAMGAARGHSSHTAPILPAERDIGRSYATNAASERPAERCLPLSQSKVLKNELHHNTETGVRQDSGVAGSRLKPTILTSDNENAMS